MYPKIKFTAKNWSGLCNFYSKAIFWKFLRKLFLLLFFAEYELLIFHNKIVKISEKLNKHNLLKICLQITYPLDLWCVCVWVGFVCVCVCVCGGGGGGGRGRGREGNLGGNCGTGVQARIIKTYPIHIPGL